MSKPKFYETVAIPYANGEPHLGHAYEAIAADSLARFKRLDGFDVRLQTGMDEHGQKNEQTAAKLGKTPQELVDGISATFKKLYDDLQISYDGFIRTTSPDHKRRVQRFWEALEASGDVYLGHYKGWYDVRNEAYFDESELTVGPDGKKYSPHKAPVEWMEEECYFFRLSAYQDRLLALYEKNPAFILPTFRRNEIVSFVKSGLQDVCLSRTNFSWGVPVPNHPGHIMYVWLDALSNYVTALGYSEPDNLMDHYWPAEIEVVGKDILRFHAIYWPAFLMAVGLALPKTISAHGFIYTRGEKMSKSLGNVITPYELTEKYGLDAVRYFLLRDMAYGQDGDITHEAVIQRTNSDLANDLGNLAQRSLSMIQKNCGAVVPTPGAFTAADQAFLDRARNLLPLMRGEMDAQAFHKALDAVWAVISEGNRYVDEQAPWTLKKTDPPRMETVLYVLAEVVRCVAILLQPFMPGSMARMLDQLAVGPEARDFTFVSADHALKAGTPLPAPQGIFPRYIAKEETP